MSDELIGLDFETYGAVDLKTHGLDRYLGDSSFQPLIASVVDEEFLGAQVRKVRLDLCRNFQQDRRTLAKAVDGRTIVAHNAPFEQGVLASMGIHIPEEQFLDSAVVARAAGAGSSLEAAAPQLVTVDKMAAGKNLIKLFSIPGKYQEKYGTRDFCPEIIDEHPDEWKLFGHYCDLDSLLGLRIGRGYGMYLTRNERAYAAITTRMNRAGWPVDVALVEEMQRRYLENQEMALNAFLIKNDPFVGTEKQLNLNSLKQLKEWCAARGIRATSFDEQHVAALLKRLDKKLGSMSSTDPKWDGYWSVRDLLETKQILGGSSLKKLQTILDTVGEDGRLRNQYLHCGAGQTLRTTGRSVQMQNLKRIGSEPDDMDELLDLDTDWDNAKLARNLRQSFTASERDGRLIVGDFSSIESRGLAWQACAYWKTEAFQRNQDMYKVLAAKIFGVAYDDVTKEQRQVGKVGELACGYGAGGGAVQAFAANMGVELTEGEASKLVSDWREANPEIVEYWELLHILLQRAIETSSFERTHLREGWCLELRHITTPVSLLRQQGRVQSIEVAVTAPDNTVFLRRIFHGCYMRGRNVAYHRATDRKTGDLWSASYVDPKTKERRFYELYGGKLAGILTQSFCRELFFLVLRNVDAWTNHPANENLTLVGQFHDEIVVDWKPPGPPHTPSLAGAMRSLEILMSDPGPVKGFPLAAEIKSDYRYTK